MKNPRTLLALIFLALTVLLSACSGAISASSWPGIATDGNNAYVASAQHVYAIKLSDGSMAWRFPDKAGKTTFYATPAITSDGQLIVGGFDNMLYSLNPQNGTQNWTFTAGDRWIGGVFTQNGDIYAPNTDRHLYNLDLKGNKKWSFATGNANWAAPAADDQTLYLGSMDHNLYAISRSTGQKLWQTDIGGAIAGTPSLTADGLLLVGTLANQLVAVNAKSGQVAWRFDTTGGVWSAPAIQDKSLYFGDLKGAFYSLDVATQKPGLQITPDGPVVSLPLLLKDKLVFVTEAGIVQALDYTGKILWSHQINGKLYTAPVQAGDRILVAVTQGDSLLVALDQSGNQVWSFTPPK